MDIKDIIILIESIALGLLLITAIVLGVKLKRKSALKRDDTKAGNVHVVEGVRYTKDKNETKADGGAAVTHVIGDFILERGITFTARKNSRLLPGKYTILSGVENAESFNVRIGGIVREIKHASDIVIAEGDEICAVSHPAILR